MAESRWTTDTIPVALAGGGQAGAPQIRPQSMTTVTTVATAADSVMLPSAVPGSSVYVQNGAAANAMAVFPSKGDSTNALAADAAFSIAANKLVQFCCIVGGKWATILTA